VRGEALRSVPEEERGGRAERGDLREGEVHEDDLALEHVDPEIRVDRHQRGARERGKGEQLDHFARRRTSSSMSER
jgi:hypothetical protein